MVEEKVFEQVEGEIVRIEPGHEPKPTRATLRNPKGRVMVATWDVWPPELKPGMFVRLNCEVRWNGEYKNLILQKVLGSADKAPYAYADKEPQKTESALPNDPAVLAQKAALMKGCLEASIAIFSELNAKGDSDLTRWVHPEQAFALAVSVAQSLYNDCGKDRRTPGGV